MAQQGFDDSLRFLHRNNLINCTRCLSVQSTYRLSDTIDDSVEYESECHECNLQRQESLVSGLPENVVSVLQEAVESNNKGLLNWIFQNQTIKIITLPYLVPADLVYATFLKFLEAVPYIQKSVSTLSQSLIQFVINMATMVNPKSKQVYSAKFSCQLAITEYTEGSHPTDMVDHLRVRRASTAGVSLLRPPSIGDMPLRRKSLTEITVRRPSIKNKMNFGFTMNLEKSDAIPVVHGEPIPRPASVGTPENEAIGKIMDVANTQDALMSYYYLDENNHVKVTEIFDVTEADTSAVLSENEREINSQLQFDDDQFDYYNDAGLEEKDWEETFEPLDMSTNSDEGQESMTSFHQPDGVFSDPESEWSHGIPPLITVTPFPSNSQINVSSSSLAESDRPLQTSLSRKSSFAIIEDC